MKSDLFLDIPASVDFACDVWEAGEIPHLEGPPGIGKTEVLGLAAEVYLGKLAAAGKIPPLTGPLPYFPRTCSTMDGPDVVMPRPGEGGRISFTPVGPFWNICAAPGVMLLDELTRTGVSVQNAFLTGLQSRIWGDFVMHPLSRIATAANDSDEEGGDGARKLIGALEDRLIKASVRATFGGVFDFLNDRVGEPGSLERELAIDYAFTADRSRELVSLAPEPGEGKRPSPRAIVKLVKLLATSLRNKRTDAEIMLRLSGAVGEEAAGAYLAIRKIRAKLPSPEEIAKSPKSARLPESIDVALAVMGVLGVVATKHADAAWIYLGRMDATKEVQVAASKALLRKAQAPKSQEALDVRNRMLGTVGLANAGRAVGLSW